MGTLAVRATPSGVGSAVGVGVRLYSGVAVGSGVEVGLGVRVGSRVGVAVGIAVGVGDFVAVGAGESVAEGVEVGSGVAVGGAGSAEHATSAVASRMVASATRRKCPLHRPRIPNPKPQQVVAQGTCRRPGCQVGRRGADAMEVASLKTVRPESDRRGMNL
jgi:hypothetical protein